MLFDTDGTHLNVTQCRKPIGHMENASTPHRKTPAHQHPAFLIPLSFLLVIVMSVMMDSHDILQTRMVHRGYFTYPVKYVNIWIGTQFSTDIHGFQAIYCLVKDILVAIQSLCLCVEHLFMHKDCVYIET